MSAEPGSVGIVIPLFRGEQQLQRCLSGIARQQGVRHETFVRDNNRNNVYYTAAINEGIVHFLERPHCRYVLALNQDAYLQPGCLQQLVDFMEANPACGIAAPAQVAPGADGKLTVWWAGSLAAFPSGAHVRDARALAGPPMPTPWANGACMLLRREMIREIGLLDRNLRFLYSDSDYSFSARARGWQVYLVPQARVVHEPGASRQGAEVNELERVKVLDMQYFMRKWLSGDLYRSLAVEGPTLGEAFLRDHQQAIEATLARIDRALGRSS